MEEFILIRKKTKRANSCFDFLNSKKTILNSKRSQVWGFDLMIAFVIFIVGIIAIYIYAINFVSESQSTLDTLFSEGSLLSSLVLSEGTPNNWTEEDVEIPGILSLEKIDQTKLDNFYSLSQNYESLKILLGLSTNNEFYFSFSNLEVSRNSIEGIGLSPENQENLVRIERFSIYKNKPAKIIFYIWN